jgi:hypothetical protein
MEAMDTRRRWLGKIFATGTVAVCGCGSTGGDAAGEVASRSSPTPAATAPTGPEPWEPVDPAFTGCAGG